MRGFGIRALLGVAGLVAAGCGPIGAGVWLATKGGSGSSSGGAAPAVVPAGTSVGPAGGTLTSGAVTVEVPPGAVSSTVQLSIAGGSAVAQGEFVGVGPAVLLGPEGASFAVPVQVTLSYDPANFPPGKTVADLVVLKRSEPGGAIQTLTPTTIDTATLRVTVQVTSFSTFQCAIRSGVDAARSRVQLANGAVWAGSQPVTVTVTVRNAAGLPIEGKTVVLSATGGVSVTQPSQPTDANGVAQGALVPLQVGSAVVSARVDSTTLDEQPTLNVTAPPPGPAPPPKNDHVLITEVVWNEGTSTANPACYIELHNPTAAAIDLSTYYLTDANQSPISGSYADLPGYPGNGSQLGLANDLFDFVLRFPAGSILPAGGTITVAVDGVGFAATYGQDATYCIGSPGGSTVQMFNLQYSSKTFTQAPPAGTSVWHWTGEKIALFRWDGVSDLVQDVDVVQVTGLVVGAATDKTGITSDGPDADLLPSAYLPDTAEAMQAVAPISSFLISQRLDLTEAGETKTGGNGITGHDETSEPLNLTWITAPTATPGTP